MSRHVWKRWKRETNLTTETSCQKISFFLTSEVCTRFSSYVDIVYICIIRARKGDVQVLCSSLGSQYVQERRHAEHAWTSASYSPQQPLRSSHPPWQALFFDITNPCNVLCGRTRLTKHIHINRSNCHIANIDCDCSRMCLLDGDWSASLPASSSQDCIDVKLIHLFDISTPSTFPLSKGLHQERMCNNTILWRTHGQRSGPVSI